MCAGKAENGKRQTANNMAEKVCRFDSKVSDRRIIKYDKFMFLLYFIRYL